MAKPAVVFNGVWKKFKRGERHDSLRDLIPATISRFTRGRPPAAELQNKEFWAVRDVSFEVGPGDALGIIGQNGAGKSTILKLLTRILRPTSGTCDVRGRAGALIEVAAGFHPDLTGRENVFLQGSIMGMKRAEILQRFDQIVAFAGVSEFIDTPVKRYSSGMNARLGFAIAAHLDPDVLLIDEVLSVGDAAFQDRCVTRMKELIRRGTPLVFISHNLPAVLELCTRVVVLDHGSVKFDGEPGKAIQEYQLAPAQDANNQIGKRNAIVLDRVELLNEAGESSAVFQTNGPMRVKIGYRTLKPTADVSFAVDIYRGDGIYCAGINTMMDRRDLGVLDGNGTIELVLPQVSLLPGCYLVSVGILDAADGGYHDVRLHAYPFSVMSDRRDLGMIYVPHDWRLNGESLETERRPVAKTRERASVPDASGLLPVGQAH